MLPVLHANHGPSFLACMHVLACGFWGDFRTDLCLSVRLFISLSVCLSACLPARLPVICSSVPLSVRRSICLSVTARGLSRPTVEEGRPVQNVGGLGERGPCANDASVCLPDSVQVLDGQGDSLRCEAPIKPAPQLAAGQATLHGFLAASCSQPVRGEDASSGRAAGASDRRSNVRTGALQPLERNCAAAAEQLAAGASDRRSDGRTATSDRCLPQVVGASDRRSDGLTGVCGAKRKMGSECSPGKRHGSGQRAPEPLVVSTTYTWPRLTSMMRRLNPYFAAMHGIAFQ
jgi:hypothetical protein